MMRRRVHERRRPDLRADGARDVTVDVVVDGEVVPTLDKAAAERLDKRIRLLVGSINDSVSKLCDRVSEAKCGELHVALGFPSWTAYIADVFAPVHLALDRQERRELVGYLSGEGMSQRAIAATVGVDQKTVSNDLRREEHSSPEPITGRDGKTYRRRRSTDLRPEAAELTARIRDGVQTWKQGVVSAGRNLTAAMAHLKRDQWLSMLAKIGIGEASAALIMTVAQDPGRTDLWDDLTSCLWEWATDEFDRRNE
jgi:predicted transcriptional regulator